MEWSLSELPRFGTSSRRQTPSKRRSVERARAGRPRGRRWFSELLLLFGLLVVGGRIEADTGAARTPIVDEEPTLIAFDDLDVPVEPAPALDDQEERRHDDSESKIRIGLYDPDRKHFVLVRSGDSDPVPFELTVEMITQLRYSGFARSSQTWIDSTGASNTVNNTSVFEINRNWVEFNGYALDPKLQFRTIVFTSTASNNAIFLGYLRYEFDPALRLNGGYWKVPGTREWANSFSNTLGVDRTMATTFFRPGFSPGIWVDGDLGSGLNYIAMLANSIRSEAETANRIGTNMVYSAGLEWQPWGDFGPGPSDIEDHRDPAARLGSIVTFTRKVNQGTSEPANPEDTIIRLSDGTPLFLFQALGPGSQLNAANFLLWTLDAGVKWRGLSVTGEYFLRWLGSFSYSGAAPERSSLFDHGGYLQSGVFAIPRTLEGYLRSSTVTGPFGRGYEWSLGFNWFPREARSWRVSFDVTRILHSPADNILTGYRAGESGTLFQAQMLVDF